MKASVRLAFAVSLLGFLGLTQSATAQTDGDNVSGSVSASGGGGTSGGGGGTISGTGVIKVRNGTAWFNPQMIATDAFGTSYSGAMATSTSTRTDGIYTYITWSCLLPVPSGSYSVDGQFSVYTGPNAVVNVRANIGNITIP